MMVDQSIPDHIRSSAMVRQPPKLLKWLRTARSACSERAAQKKACTAPKVLRWEIRDVLLDVGVIEKHLRMRKEAELLAYLTKLYFPKNSVGV